MDWRVYLSWDYKCGEGSDGMRWRKLGAEHERRWKEGVRRDFVHQSRSPFMKSHRQHLSCTTPLSHGGGEGNVGVEEGGAIEGKLVSF